MIQLSIAEQQHLTELQEKLHQLFLEGKEPIRPEYGSQQLFYQSCSLLNLPGLRNTSQRIVDYKLKKYLNQNFDILDIGCNIGAFDFELAPYVRSITGVDLVEHNIFFANEFKKLLKIDNINFIQNNIKDIDFGNKKFDFIMILSMDGCFHSQSSVNYFNLDTITALLKPSGILLLVTHESPWLLYKDATGVRQLLPQLIYKMINKYKVLETNQHNYVYLQKI